MVHWTNTVTKMVYRRRSNAKSSKSLPRCSMYGIFTYIWAMFGVNVGKYGIDLNRLQRCLISKFEVVERMPQASPGRRPVFSQGLREKSKWRSTRRVEDQIASFLAYKWGSGWWFQTFFLFSHILGYIGDTNPNWRTHIFQGCWNHQPGCIMGILWGLWRHNSWLMISSGIILPILGVVVVHFHWESRS